MLGDPGALDEAADDAGGGVAVDLAGRTPPALHRPNAHVSPGLSHVLDHLTDSAAIVVSDLGETHVQNRVAIARMVRSRVARVSTAT